MSDPLYTAVTGHAYFSIRLQDVPPQYILGGRCGVCPHRGPVDRYRIEGRWGNWGYLRMLDDRLRCLVCGNRHENRFTVIGTYLPEPRLAEVVQIRKAS